MAEGDRELSGPPGLGAQPLRLHPLVESLNAWQFEEDFRIKSTGRRLMHEAQGIHPQAVVCTLLHAHGGAFSYTPRRPEKGQHLA